MKFHSIFFFTKLSSKNHFMFGLFDEFSGWQNENVMQYHEIFRLVSSFHSFHHFLTHHGFSNSSAFRKRLRHFCTGPWPTRCDLVHLMGYLWDIYVISTEKNMNESWECLCDIYGRFVWGIFMNGILREYDEIMMGI